jgi:hypothetical protein
MLFLFGEQGICCANNKIKFYVFSLKQIIYINYPAQQLHRKIYFRTFVSLWEKCAFSFGRFISSANNPFEKDSEKTVFMEFQIVVASCGCHAPVCRSICFDRICFPSLNKPYKAQKPALIFINSRKDE